MTDNTLGIGLNVEYNKKKNIHVADIAFMLEQPHIGIKISYKKK